MTAPDANPPADSQELGRIARPPADQYRGRRCRITRKMMTRPPPAKPCCNAIGNRCKPRLTLWRPAWAA